MLRDLYGHSLALLTDLYQLTMGLGYWRSGIHSRRAAFHLFFRTCPFGGQYAIAAGLAPVVEWLTSFQVDSDDIEYLRSLTGNDQERLFPEDFLRAIGGMRLEIDVDAIPEGTVVMAQQPLMRVTGPIWQCQWIETTLLCILNFQTLIATKAARVCEAAKDNQVLEFGLRRAQGIDGGISASRAAFVGGCHATSNVMAGQLLGIPVKGTHAHSWVMAFDDELESFRAYADAMPNNCVFLVDTYDTIEGVKHAIEVGRQLKRDGHKMIGIRLDSGDLAQLSIQARHLLDEAGFTDAQIVASSDLDEYAITDLKARGAKIDIWGVGTNLVTAHDQPALGGVYKLGAIENLHGQWEPRIKLSNMPIKTTIPGIQQVRRYFRGNQMVGDLLYSELIGPPESNHAVSFAGDPGVINDHDRHEDLLVPVLRGGQPVNDLPTLEEIRSRAIQQRAMLPADIRRIKDARPYSVMLEPRLAAQKQQMIDEHRARQAKSPTGAPK